MAILGLLVALVTEASERAQPVLTEAVRPAQSLIEAALIDIVTGGRVEVGSEPTVTDTQIGSFCVETLAVRGTELCFLHTLVNISAAGAVNLPVPLGAGTGVGAQVVDALSYGLTWPGFLYTLIHIVTLVSSWRHSEARPTVADKRAFSVLAVASGTDSLILALIDIYTLASLRQETIRTRATAVTPGLVEADTRRTRCSVCTFINIYAGGLGVIQLVSLITVAGVALSCVVTNPLAANVRVDLALIHLS